MLSEIVSGFRYSVCRPSYSFGSNNRQQALALLTRKAPETIFRSRQPLCRLFTLTMDCWLRRFVNLTLSYCRIYGGEMYSG